MMVVLLGRFILIFPLFFFFTVVSFLRSSVYNPSVVAAPDRT
jgi:hypothetical protein